MADQENTEIEETAAAEVAADAPEATVEQTEAQASAEAETAAASEPETAAASEPAAPAAAAEPAAPAQPQVQLSPKERKLAVRARKVAKVAPRGETSPEARQAERTELRAKKAAERRAGRATARTKWKAGAHERTATPPREHETGTQKTRQGVVVSDKADKTITVRIDVARRHRKYQKIVRTSNTLHAHDESNDAHIGDTVVVRESRPLSRSKRWRLVEVVERAK
jgi:small subunit ribosomal protein S17